MTGAAVTPSAPALMSKSDFARHIGRDKSWVTRAAQAGRIVLEGNGPAARVRVLESIRLLESTSGHRDDVARRHAEQREAAWRRAREAREAETAETAQNRAGEANGGSDEPEAVPGADRATAAPSDPGDATLVEARRAKLLAESRRAQAAADREEMERDREAGQLLRRDDVEAAFKFVGAALRGLLDVLPDQLAPVVAPVTDADEVHAQLAQAARDVLVRWGEVIDRQRAALIVEPARAQEALA
jgi:hypothetical protein